MKRHVLFVVMVATIVATVYAQEAWLETFDRDESPVTDREEGQ